MQGYKDQYKRLLARKFLQTNNGKRVLKKQREIGIVNVISKKDLLKYPHLNLGGEIIIRKDVNSYIPEIDLRFENYFPATHVFGRMILMRAVYVLLKVIFLFLKL